MAAKAGSSSPRNKTKPDLKVVTGSGADTSAPPPPQEPERPNVTQEDKDDLFLVHLAQARQDNEKQEVLKNALRVFNKQRTLRRAACRADGFPLAQLDEILKDELEDAEDVAKREEARARMRGLAGVAGGSKQQDLFDDSFAKREAHEQKWLEHGLLVGLRGANPDPGKYNVPPDLIQDWEAKRREGQDRLGKALATSMRMGGPRPEGMEHLTGSGEAPDAPADAPAGPDAPLTPGSEEAPGDPDADQYAREPVGDPESPAAPETVPETEPA